MHREEAQFYLFINLIVRMKTIYIGVSGVAGSGKDMFFSLLQKQLVKTNLPVHRYALADDLKKECSVYLKKHHDIDILSCSRKDKDLVRPFLVFHGTLKRNRSLGRHWIECMNKRLSKDKPEGVVCVTDIRYNEYEKDEVNWLKKELGGVLVHITQEGIEPINSEEETQDPKLRLDCSYKIEWPHVSGSLEEVESQLLKYVEQFISWLEHELGHSLSSECKNE